MVALAVHQLGSGRSLSPRSPGFVGHLSPPRISSPLCFLLPDWTSFPYPPLPSLNICSVPSGIPSCHQQTSLYSQPLLWHCLSFLVLAYTQRSPSLLGSLPECLLLVSVTSCTSMLPFATSKASSLSKKKIPESFRWNPQTVVPVAPPQSAHLPSPHSLKTLKPFSHSLHYHPVLLIVLGDFRIYTANSSNPWLLHSLVFLHTYDLFLHLSSCFPIASPLMVTVQPQIWILSLSVSDQ